MEENEKIVPMKRTSSEQRKLRSRDAARCRRSKETEVFYELARTLPLPRRVSTQLDKAAIMRVALSFLSLQRLLRPETKNQKIETEEEDEEEEEDTMDTFYPQVLAGFVLVMSEEGDMIYLTENVSKHIGITQLELLGQSIYDFVHPCDQEELRDLLAPRPGLSKKPGADQSSERNFFMRMKSTLTSRGRTVNIKSADWKVLHCTGHMRPLSCGSTSPPTGRVMTLLCEPIPHPSSVEFPLDTHTFLSRHSMDLRFTHCEGRVMELTGYRPDDLIGCSAYEFHHALDSDHVNKSLHTLLSKGQVSTSCYRFMANGGGFVWAQTQATVLYNSKTSHPEAVVCLNFILSGVQQPDVVFSIEQIRSSRSSRAEPDTREDVTPCDITDCDGERPHSSGEKPDCDGDLFSKLKEEPEELLQVASAAGETLSTLTGDSAELSFYSPLTPDSVPEHPQDLCSPKLRQLLAPIFDPFTPPSSTSSSPPPSLSPASSPEPHPSTDDSVDTSEVEKFFAVCSVDDVKTDEILEGMDLDMLAPYISMDDDFQLTFLGSNLTEKAEKPSLTSEPTATTPDVSVRRKRAHGLDEEFPSELMIQAKRQKQEASSIEEELLLSHRLLDCLQETDQSDLVLLAGSGGRSQLLTDKDPLLGGDEGLCDTAALMRDIFSSRPPDASPSLAAMT